jgi:O-succinylbenzoic acid--CoA ligase
MIIDSWLQRAALAHPDRTAIETPAGAATYSELYASALAGARELEDRGVSRGERVGIALPGGPAFAQWLHACLLRGALAVPLDPRLSAAERERIAAGCALVVAEPIAGDHARRSARAARDRHCHELEQGAVVIHTSGTTAAPKPVTLTYGNFLWSALGSAVALGLDPQERWLCTLPVCHVGGLSILVRSAIYATTAVLHERFDEQRALHALRRERITLVSLVAVTLQRLLDGGLREPPHLRAALIGGGPVPAELIERARAAGIPASLTYGLSQACSQVATEPLAALGEGARPLFCTRVRIAPDGEILVAGPTVAPACIAADGYLHTGDRGTLDKRGALHVEGRIAETIITGGENVAPAEVEAALEAHPQVAEAGIYSLPDRRWGEAVCAVVVPLAGCAPGAEELREHCAARLAPFKVPKRITILRSALPRTASGKLLRGKLAALGEGAGEPALESA